VWFGRWDVLPVVMGRSTKDLDSFFIFALAILFFALNNQKRNTKYFKRSANIL